MKILIVALPRTGSTSLLNLLSSCLNLKRVSEPLRPSKSSTEHEEYLELVNSPGNFVVKDILYSRPANILEEEYLEWLTGFCKNFNKVVFLSRKNKKDHLESIVNLLYQNELYYSKNIGSTNSPTVTKYIYENIPPDKVKEIRTYPYFQFLVKCRDIIKKLSRKLNIDLIWYEDIFIEDNRNELVKTIFPELSGLDISYYLNSRNKLRVTRGQVVI